MSELISAHCLTGKTGVLIFEEDVKISSLSKITVQGQLAQLSYCSKQVFGQNAGYFIEKNSVVFYLDKKIVPSEIIAENTVIFVAGDFNNWQKNMAYELKWKAQNKAWILKIPLKKLPQCPLCFKFVTALNQWIEPSKDCRNISIDSYGNKNLKLDFKQTWKHWILFELKNALDITEPILVQSGDKAITADALPLLDSFYSHKRLGAYIEKGKTCFACFAPTAKKVEVKITQNTHTVCIPLKEDSNGVWACECDEDFSNGRYVFNVWNPEQQELVDPYAVALNSPQGPGIICNLKPFEDNFKTPRKKDLSILEVHVRDLLSDKGPKNESIFSRLTHFFKNPNYVESLGVNCVEFQPLTEFDTDSKNAYHWGYMPAHYFALSSCYGNQTEFQQCVKVMHAHGIAVILDVVYNHAGEMNDLLKWSKDYYFNHNSDGTLTNVSGCGNDLRAEAPMTRKLILDSLLHLLNTYHIDGFRFDLAEILGIETLNYLSTELKKQKSDIILIAEPWSFQGHIAYQLKGSDYSCWNDGYREFLLKYIQGQGNVEGFKYFLQGSTAFLCKKSQESVNYTESHDDYCWRDRLTGDFETIKRKTHCMFATLFMSLGIPMISEGQDFLRTKKGVRNTYNRGDLNLLNYQDLENNQDTHLYVKNLIALRASKYGDLLKITRPTKTYFKYFYDVNSSAIGVLFNADNSLGNTQLLFVINPHEDVAHFNFEDLIVQNFYLLANTMCFLEKKNVKLTSGLTLQPNSCAIFITK